RIYQRTNVHLLVVGRYHHRRRPEELAMASEIDPRSVGFGHGRLPRPDVESPAQLTDQRRMLEQEGDRLDGSNERARQQGMDDVEGNRLHMREALMRGHVHQLVLAQADLAGGGSQAAPY